MGSRHGISSRHHICARTCGLRPVTTVMVGGTPRRLQVAMAGATTSLSTSAHTQLAAKNSASDARRFLLVPALAQGCTEIDIDVGRPVQPGGALDKLADPVGAEEFRRRQRTAFRVIPRKLDKPIMRAVEITDEDMLKLFSHCLWIGLKDWGHGV